MVVQLWCCSILTPTCNLYHVVFHIYKIGGKNPYNLPQFFAAGFATWFRMNYHNFWQFDFGKILTLFSVRKRFHDSFYKTVHRHTMTRLENNQMSCTTTVMPTLFIFSYVLALFLLWALSWKTKWSLSHRLFHLYHKPKIMLAWNYFFLFLFIKFVGFCIGKTK